MNTAVHAQPTQCSTQETGIDEQHALAVCIIGLQGYSSECESLTEIGAEHGRQPPIMSLAISWCKRCASHTRVCLARKQLYGRLAHQMLWD